MSVSVGRTKRLAVFVMALLMAVSALAVSAQEAQAHFLLSKICASGLHRGDWIQHFHGTRHTAYRTVKTSSQYIHNGEIYANGRAYRVRYNSDYTKVKRIVFVKSFTAHCGTVR